MRRSWLGALAGAVLCGLAARAPAGWRCDGVATCEAASPPWHPHAWADITNAPAVTNYLPGTGMTAITNGGTVTLNSTATGGGVVLPGVGMGVTTNGSTNTVYWINESLWTPTVLTSASTVTITRANGSLLSLWVTNSPLTLTFQVADWTTNDVGRVSLDLWAGTNTITFNTNTISGASALSVSTTTNTTLQFRLGKWSRLFAVRQ